MQIVYLLFQNTVFLLCQVLSRQNMAHKKKIREFAIKNINKHTQKKNKKGSDNPINQNQATARRPVYLMRNSNENKVASSLPRTTTAVDSQNTVYKKNSYNQFQRVASATTVTMSKDLANTEIIASKSNSQLGDNKSERLHQKLVYSGFHYLFFYFFYFFFFWFCTVFFYCAKSQKKN